MIFAPHVTTISLALVTTMLALTEGIAQSYPAKSLRLVVPFTAGGGSDVTARLVSEKLTTALGQPVIVDNRPGASGNIGIRYVAKAAPDGYTFLIMSSNFALNPTLYANAGYDPFKDFEPVAGLTSYMFYLVCHPSLPVRSVKALIALAKAQPGKLSFASGGIATGSHIAGEMFNAATGVKLTHVPYKGVGPAIYETLGGQIPITFGVPEVVPHIKAGKLIALGVTGPARSPGLPNVPTIAESGLPDFDVSSWHAMFAPLGTAEAIVKRINEEVRKGLGRREVADLLRQKDMELALGAPQELTALVKRTHAKQSKVVKDVGIKMD